MNQLTNQELLQELNKRIQTGTLRTQIVADEIHETSSSLLALLGSKEWLFLIGLTVGFTVLFCYSIKVTSNKVASCKVKFDQNPPLTLNP